MVLHQWVVVPTQFALVSTFQEQIALLSARVKELEDRLELSQHTQPATHPPCRALPPFPVLANDNKNTLAPLWTFSV